MDELVWDDPPSLLDDSELSSSALDTSHVPHADENDGEMELSSSLNLSLSPAVSDSEDDRTPLFSKPNPRLPTETAHPPHLSHLTERQQLAYLMRTTQQQRHRTKPTTSKQQPQRHPTAPLPPAHPPHSKSKPQPTTATTAPKQQPSKPSMLTHDKKRRRTTTATAAIDPDDSHLYTVQRLPPAATAPAPLPQPAEYDSWGVERRRRWDRVSEQPGLYYYHHTAPGVTARTGEWDESERDMLLHLLVCHPMAGGARRGGASEWGLFSINLPGRVGAECERQWKELAAAGAMLSADTFDYMRWYARQKQRTVDSTPASAANTPGATTIISVNATGAADVKSSSASLPAVMSRKRVAAPALPPSTDMDNVKGEAVEASVPDAVHVEAAAREQVAAVVERPVQKVSLQAKTLPDVVAAGKGPVQQPLHNKPKAKLTLEAVEQPPRKKIVRFQPRPTASPPPTEAAPVATTPIVEAGHTVADTSPTTVQSVAPRTTGSVMAASRRPLPSRVAIPALPTTQARASEEAQSVLWPPRPPRMPAVASPVPSTITAHCTAVSATKRLDTSQLTVDTQTSHATADTGERL